MALVFIGWLAGSLSGGCNLNTYQKTKEPADSAAKSAVQTKTEESAQSSALQDPKAQKELAEQYKKKYWFEHSLLNAPLPEEGKKTPAWYMAAVVWPLVIVAILLVLVIVWFWIWLSARFQFIWYYAIDQNEVAIGRTFRQYADVADSLMLFGLASSAVALCYFSAILFPAGYSFIQVARISPKLMTDIPFILANFWPILLLILFSGLVLLVVYAIVSDFILPIMARQRVYFMEASRLWMPIYKVNRLAVWRYFVMKILASIVGGALTLALSVTAALALLFVSVLLLGPLYMIFMWWFKLKWIFMILAFLVGAPLVVILILVMGACALPASVFMRVYSLAFLNCLQLDSELESDKI